MVDALLIVGAILLIPGCGPKNLEKRPLLDSKGDCPTLRTALSQD
jgi:hypothetical protein